MRFAFVLLASVASLAATAPATAQMRDGDDGFDDRGYDRNDRAPDWSYRRGESDGRGAYYDGGRYGPAGLLGEQAALDPWLEGTDYARLAPAKANRGFRHRADRNGDARLTDLEISTALVTVEKAGR